MTYRPGQLVRILGELRATPAAGTVARITPTLIILRDGRRFCRDTGRLHGMGPSVVRIEAWGEQHKGAA